MKCPYNDGIACDQCPDRKKCDEDETDQSKNTPQDL